MGKKSSATIFEHFSELEDPRIDRTKDHLLIDIIVITICGVICGADDWVAIEKFGKAKKGWFRTFLKLPISTIISLSLIYLTHLSNTVPISIAVVPIYS